MGGESIGAAERTAQLMGRLRAAVKAAGAAWKGLDWEPSHSHVSVFARRLWAMLAAKTPIEVPEMNRPGELAWWDFDPVMVSPCEPEERMSRSHALQQLSLAVEIGISLEALPAVCAEAQRLTEIETAAAAADAERALGYGQRALQAAEQGDYRAAAEAASEAVRLEHRYRDERQVHVWSAVHHWWSCSTPFAQGLHRRRSPRSGSTCSSPRTSTRAGSSGGW